jgi:RNA polymerase sigma-70 factor, ECF subfamily
MATADSLAATFEANRPRLRALAYRMLGSVDEAEDAVQETWLRVTRAGSDDVENFGGWLTTIAGRICLDRLRARRARPEDPAGIDPPEQVAASDPEAEAVLADSIGSAMLVVLDALAPAERVAFVLHDVFAVPFDEIGDIVDRTPDAARQLASRARRRVQGTTPTGEVDLVRRREIVSAFLAAARGGDFEALLAVLDPDVVLRPDAEAIRLGAPGETHGAQEVATMMRGGARASRLALVGGVAGLAWMPAGRLRGAVEFRIVDDRIAGIDFVGDHDRLAALDVVVLED